MYMAGDLLSWLIPLVAVFMVYLLLCGLSTDINIILRVQKSLIGPIKCCGQTLQASQKTRAIPLSLLQENRKFGVLIGLTGHLCTHRAQPSGLPQNDWMDLVLPMNWHSEAYFNNILFK